MHAPLLAYTGWLFLLQGPPIAVLAVVRRGRRLPEALRTSAATGLVGGVISIAAYTIVLWAQTSGALAPMLEHVTPAVVNINSKTRVRVRDPFFDDPMFRRFFGMPPDATPQEREFRSADSHVRAKKYCANQLERETRGLSGPRSARVPANSAITKS